MTYKELLQLVGLLSVPVALIWQGSAAAGDQSLPIGDPIPSFQANDQNGNLWRSQDHLGKGFLVVYFYPAALTGG